MATINISDVVSDSIDGTGVFDVLMNSVELRLQQQFEKNRIKGTDYATVYLGAMQSVMQQSIAYVLGVQQADKQADLIASQILQANEQTSLVTKQITLADEQLLKVTAEKELLNQKKTTEEAQTVDIVNPDGVTPVAGIVGKQKELFSKQTDGFIRDAEQKAAKVFSDMWTIAKSTDSSGTPDPTHIDAESIDVVLEKIALGIGISKVDLDVNPPPPP